MSKNPQLVGKASSMPNLVGAAGSPAVACPAVLSGFPAPTIAVPHTCHCVEPEAAGEILGHTEEMLSPEQLATVANVLQDVAAFRALSKDKVRGVVG